MTGAHKHPQLRVIMLISGTKVADEANKLLLNEQLPVFYQFRGQGTASNEMMDMLGLGSTAKVISVSIMKKDYAERVLEKMETELGLNYPGTGIALTLVITGVSALTMKIIDEYSRREIFEKMENDANQAAQCSKHSMIVAVVNQGYSEDVMDAAREFGAGGGTVVHARQAGGEAILSFLGLPIHEERELVFIMAKTEMKVAIMKAIGEQCGMQSEAQGVVISTPIDSIVGLS